MRLMGFEKTEKEQSKKGSKSLPERKGFGPHQGPDKDLIKPEIIEEDERIDLKDPEKRKATEVGVGRGGFVPIEEISNEDYKRVYGEDLEELEAKYYQDEWEDYLERIYGQTGLEEFQEMYETAENEIKHIKNPILKEMGEQILKDAGEFIGNKKLEQHGVKSKKKRVTVKTEQEGKVAHVFPIRPIKHFAQYFKHYDRAEVRKIPFEEIEKFFYQGYNGLAKMTGLDSDFAYFKSQYFPQELSLDEKEQMKKERGLEKADDSPIIKMKISKEYARLLEEVKGKYGFDLKDLSTLSNYNIDTLIDYLDDRKKVEDVFQSMSAHKKSKGEDEEFVKLKDSWEQAKKVLASYQLKPDMPADKIDKADTTPKFIRKYNLGTLNKEHSLFLREVLQKILVERREIRGRKRKTRVAKKKAAIPTAAKTKSEWKSIESKKPAKEELVEA